MSVIIPTYGRPEYFQEAVESINNQTYSPIELVVVDDASPEPVEPLLSDIDTESLEHVRCLRHDENRGANAARNTGLAASSGTFVAFLDDDDRWRPSKVERQVETFKTGGRDVGVVYTGLAITDGDGAVIGLSQPTVSGDVTRSLLEGVSIGSFSCVMIRKRVVDEAGPLDERFPSWQDRELYIRLSQHCQFEYVEEPLVIKRVADHRQISDDFEGKRSVSYPLLLEKYRPLAAEYGTLCERRFVAVTARSLGLSALKTNHEVFALRFLTLSLWYYPLYPKTYLYFMLALGGRFTYQPARWVKTKVSKLVR